MIPKKVYIYGRHAVREALLHAPQIVKRIEMSKSMQDTPLRQLVSKSGVDVGMLDERRVTSQVERNAPHQGIIALVSLNMLLTPFEQFYDSYTPNVETPLIFLSEVQDPHNVGAIIRSAAAFSAAAVLMPTHKQAALSGAVVKASAGMAFRVPLVAVENIQQAVARLKKKGVRIYGLAGEAAVSIADEVFDTPSLFVFGNEAEGIASTVRELVDRTVKIPIDPRCESLNVAAAAAVALFAASRQR